jgi:hypothetical protein
LDPLIKSQLFYQVTMRATAGPEEATDPRRSGSPTRLVALINSITAFTIRRANPLISLIGGPGGLETPTKRLYLPFLPGRLA